MAHLTIVPMFEATSAVLLRRVLTVLLIGAVVGTVTARAFDPARTARRGMLEQQLSHLDRTNMRLEDQNRLLHAELRLLEESDEGWKAPARQDHRMLLPGEIIFRFPTTPR